MDFLSAIDWRAVFITLCVVFIVYNTVQIIRFTMVKKRAQEELKKIDARIAAVKQELDKNRKVIEEQIKNLRK